MHAAVSDFVPSPPPPAYGAGLRAVRFGPGQGVAALRVLRRRLYDEQGGALERQGDALENSGITVAVVQAGELVAALRLHAADTPQLPREVGALLRLDRFAGSWPAESLMIGSRLAVLADYRTGAVIDLLMREAYKTLRDAGVRFVLIRCAPALHALFASYGFREYLPPAILPGGNAALRMALVCEYLPDLRASGSPLVDLVEQPEVGASAHAWLGQAFPMLD